MRAPAALLLLCLTSVAATAAGNPSAVAPPVDPTARTLTAPQIRDRAAAACRVQQARLLSRPEGAVSAPCDCYARRTIQAMGPEDVSDFRATGYFNDTTRVRALANLEACGLRRPI